MSDKKLHIAEETIQSYLEGKLSAKESHKLEKLALTDQYLSDRLNGAAVQEDLGIDMGAVQGSLKSKLANRIEEKKEPVFWLRNLGIAASILAVLGFSFFIWQNLSSSQDLSMAQKADVQEEVKIENSLPQESLEMEETPIEGERGSSIQNIVAETPNQVKEAPLKTMEEDVFLDKGLSATALKSKAPEVLTDRNLVQASDSPPKSDSQSPPPANALPAPAEKAESRTKRVSLAKINGQVVDELDDPLPGVSIRNESLGIGVTSDVNGKFEIPTSSLNDNLTMHYVGFEKKTLKAYQITDKAEKLITDKAALSEVVILTQAKDQVAQPVAGWKVLNEARRIDGEIEGRVNVSFDISSSGFIENVRITKSLSPQSDSEALEVLNKFNHWKPEITDGKPVKTTRKLSFKFLKKND